MKLFFNSPNDPKAKILQKNMALTHIKVEKVPREAIQPVKVSYSPLFEYVVVVLGIIMIVTSVLIFLPRANEISSELASVYDEIVQAVYPKPEPVPKKKHHSKSGSGYPAEHKSKDDDWKKIHVK